MSNSGWNKIMSASRFLALFDQTDKQSWQSEKECPFCCLVPHAKYIPRMSWMSPTENVTTKWLTKSWLHTMPPGLWRSHQQFESHLWSFQLCALHLPVRVSRWIPTFACRVRHVMTRTFIEYQQRASSYDGYVHWFRWWISRDAHDILQHCLWDTSLTLVELISTCWKLDSMATFLDILLGNSY